MRSLSKGREGRDGIGISVMKGRGGDGIERCRGGGKGGLRDREGLEGWVWRWDMGMGREDDGESLVECGCVV